MDIKPTTVSGQFIGGTAMNLTISTVPLQFEARPRTRSAIAITNASFSFSSSVVVNYSVTPPGGNTRNLVGRVTVLYSTDGSEPSIPLTSNLTLTKSTLLKMKVVVPGFDESVVVTKTFNKI